MEWHRRQRTVWPCQCNCANAHKIGACSCLACLSEVPQRGSQRATPLSSPRLLDRRLLPCLQPLDERSR